MGRYSLLFFGEDEVGYTNFFMLTNALGITLFLASYWHYAKSKRPYWNKFTRLEAVVGSLCILSTGEVLDEAIFTRIATSINWGEPIALLLCALWLGRVYGKTATH